MNRPPEDGDIDTRSDCSNVERLGGRRIFPMPFSLISYFSIHRSLWTTTSSKERLSWSTDLAFKPKFSASFLFLFTRGFTISISTGWSFRSRILVFGAEFLIDFFLLLTLAFDFIFQPLTPETRSWVSHYRFGVTNMWWDWDIKRRYDFPHYAQSGQSNSESHLQIESRSSLPWVSRTYLIISSISPKVEIAFIESFRSYSSSRSSIRKAPNSLHRSLIGYLMS